MKERIYLSSPHMSDEGFEQAFIQEAFDSNWVAPLGSNVDKFEEELSEMVSIDHALALANGTAAIHLALKLAGVGQGDVVLCQSMTFSATANPILYEKATPVFIDSEENGWNMDPDYLEQAIQTYRPKAVIVVHLYGLAAQIQKIKEICSRYDVILIEDAAESLGSISKGQWTGTFGDYGIYSFNGNKIITTSGGGMLVSRNQEAIEKAKFWATQSREAERHYEHKEIGYNYRLSNISAGIGRGQLKVLDDRVQTKRHIFHSYQEGLKDIEDISFIVEKEGERANYWLSAVVLKPESKVTPDMIIDALEAENVESRPAWKPMHLQPVFKGYDFVGSDRAERLFKYGLCLPSDSKMTDQEIERVIGIIRGLWNK